MPNAESIIKKNPVPYGSVPSSNASTAIYSSTDVFVNWNWAKKLWMIVAFVNVWFVLSVGMSITQYTPKKAHGRLFDESHRFMFVWICMMVFISAMYSFMLIYDHMPRTRKNIGWLNGFQFLVCNICLMFIIHQTTFKKYFGPRVSMWIGSFELVSQLAMFLCLFNGGKN